MLCRLYVKNVALIEEADVEFNEKLNVLSGETGSGKSIILDSINFVLGSKADKNMIRYGAEEAFVRVEFAVEPQSAVCKALEEFDVECEDGSIIISRKFSADGKGSIKINGNAVTAAMLKKVTAHLVDVHGQSEHFFLLNEANQLSVIDGLCGQTAIDLKDRLAELIGVKKSCKRQIEELGGNEQERARKLDLLSYQIKEIESANITPGEAEELKSKKKRMDNAEKILAAVSAIKAILCDDNGCSDLLSVAAKQACSISDFDDKYASVYDRLENLSVEAQDLGDTVSDLADDLDFDEGQAQAIDERLTLIKGLIKKYGTDEESVLTFLENARQQYAEISDAAGTIEQLNRKIEACDEQIFHVCTQLTECRKDTAKRLCADVVGQLKTLNIPNASFDVQFHPYDRENADLSSANGSDDICFMFSANKGEPLKPLNKVASGGEMSRFMLAIKTCLKDLNGISTYIFDEIDAGISGNTARSVAEKFVAISRDTQIIAVSHLPQVCAAANGEYLIYKTDEGEKTVTKIKRLEGEERVAEIIRLTGSIQSRAAHEHAEELLKSFGNG